MWHRSGEFLCLQLVNVACSRAPAHWALLHCVADPLDDHSGRVQILLHQQSYNEHVCAYICENHRMDVREIFIKTEKLPRHLLHQSTFCQRHMKKPVFQPLQHCIRLKFFSDRMKSGKCYLIAVLFAVFTIQNSSIGETTSFGLLMNHEYLFLHTLPVHALPFYLPPFLYRDLLFILTICKNYFSKLVLGHN